MRYSFTAAFLLASIVIPAWCDSREDYDMESAPLANQIPDNQPAYEPYSPRQQTDKKSYYSQGDLQHYAMTQQEHSQPTTFHQPQYKGQVHLQQDESRLAQPEDEIHNEEKMPVSSGYHMMRQGGNNFAPNYRQNMMMNGGQNFRQQPQFVPPRFTMEQQMQMQMQMQRNRMLAAAQAQAYMNQQSHQHYSQPPAQQFSQPPAQHYSQPPAQHYSHPPAQQFSQTPAPTYSQTPAPTYSQPSAPTYVQPSVQQYQPSPSVASQAQSQVESYRAPAQNIRYQPTPPPAQPKVRYSPPSQQVYYEDYENARQKE